MRLLARTLALTLALACVAPSGARAAQVPLLTHQGRAYVALDSVAGQLDGQAKLTTGRERARLSVGKRVVVLTRGSNRVVVNGRTATLGSPAVVRSGKWLVPEEFLTKVLPRVAPRARLVASRARPPAKAAPVTARVVKPVADTPPPAVREATFSELRVRSYPSFTRVVVEADAPFGHQVDKRNGEVQVRLGGLDVSEPRVEDVDDGHVGEVRLESVRGDAVVTVTFEGAVGDVRVTTFADPFRLVLDFPRRAEPPESRPSATALGHIVLDAGHGGDDSGAIGPSGLMEKDVVLDVTRRVARLVEARLGIQVTLSRSADHFIPLRERTSSANRERADLFISIHANAHRDSGSEGVETYFLSLEATDSAARQVAERENEVVALETPAAKDKMDKVRTILWDLAQSAYMEESSVLAEVVQDSMTAALRIPNRGVKQAGFYVLGGAAMPAILIEVGFVTNRREERRLRDGRYRDEIARAIFAGITAYKKRYDQRMRAGIDAQAQRP
jgi:N-acetylmuramoyl-L-alanine amidase